jgi:hypothetical protein
MSDSLPAQPKPAINHQPSGMFFSSIGGVGNCHTQERAIANQEEALARQAIGKENKSTNFHQGTGGFGNRTASISDSSGSSITSFSYSYSIMATPSSADKMKEMIVKLFKAKSKQDGNGL